MIANAPKKDVQISALLNERNQLIKQLESAIIQSGPPKTSTHVDNALTQSLRQKIDSMFGLLNKYAKDRVSKNNEILVTYTTITILD